MKEMRRNMRLISMIAIAGFILLIVYLNYTVFIYGGRWTNSARNTRLNTARKNVIAGDIFDRRGLTLATTDSEGQRVYNSDDAIRLAVSQTVGDTMGMSGTGVETFHASTLLGLSNNLFDRISQYLSGRQQRGSDIHLTIDAELSAYVADQFPDGRYGAVVLMNYKNGEVYVLVSLPGYDPMVNASRYSDDESAPYLNRALQGLYPPGSTFKIITLSAALESVYGVRGREFYCPGEMAVGEGVLTDNDRNGHGDVSLKSAFTRSCNLTFGSLALEMGASALKSRAEALGFNENFLFRDLMVYNSSYPEPESEFELAWSGVGQGRVLVSPLHMAMIASAVANGGMMVEPRLISSVIGDSGIPQVRASANVFNRRVIPSDAVSTIQEYMLAAVAQGTGSAAAIDGYAIAGKTGTAEVSSTARPHAWFVGYCADESHPLAIAIVVENGGHGGDVAAPLAAKIFKRAINNGL